MSGFRIAIAIVAMPPLCAQAADRAKTDVLVRDAPSAGNPVVASLVVDHSVVKRGSSFSAWIRLEHAPGWGTYYKNPGEAGLPTSVTWTLPEGVAAGALEYQVPVTKDFSGLPAYGFKNTAWIRARMTVSPGVADSLRAIEIGAEVRWLVCEKQQCMPGSGQLKASVQLGDENRPAADVTDLLAQAAKKFPVPLPEAWQVTLKDQALRLVAPGATPLAENEALFFYPSEAGWLTPSFTQDHEGWVVKLPEILGEVPKHLSGILVRSKENWSNEVSGRALLIGGP